MRKVARTISGVAPVAVITRPLNSCPYSCIYCPVETMNAPKSYTEKSPQVLRAQLANWNPFQQVQIRLKTFEMMGHPIDKIELLVMGGTFSSYPTDYQYEFIKGCYDGLNGFISDSLESAKKNNEKAKNRCVGLCIENRPDWCTEKIIDRLLGFGCTRTELGVQLLDDEIYKTTKRGHSIEDVVKGTQNLKDSCFKVGYHMMLGLPGSSPEKDIENLKLIFNDQRFRPDQLKIYPTFVVQGTELERMYSNGEYEPYDAEQIINLLIKIKQIVPEYTRIMKIMRDIPADYIVSSCKNSHLRDEVQRRVKELGLKCQCIRCREVGHKLLKGKQVNENKVEICRLDYDASNGKEIFLSFEDMENDILIGLLRLRIPFKPFRHEINSQTALVREIHTYGPQVPVGMKANSELQHKGYGKILLEEAERIAKEEFGMTKMIIISGVGAREYFYKFGYRIDNNYVSKQL